MVRRQESVRQSGDLRNIPIELDQFLQHDAYSIVIKGKAGTGKTALALTILSMSFGKQPCLYISSRLSIGELFQYYPWVQNFTGAKKDYSSESPDPTLEIAPFVDARLDEPSALFERITNELMDTSSPLIVIDTWDAMGDLMDKEALITNAKILQIWRQRSRAKLVFILESVEDKTFDNLVDGVIELEEKYTESRKTRRVHLSKLRGVRVSRPWSFFTLDSGVFHSFDRYNPLTPFSFPRTKGESIAAEEKEENPFPNPLDIIIGGSLPKRTVVSLELDRMVNPKIGLTMVSGTIAAVTKKNRVLLLPPKGVDSGYVEQFLKISSQNSDQRKRVEVLNNPLVPTEGQRSTFVEDLNNIVSQFKKKEPGVALFGIFSFGPSMSKKGLDMDALKYLINNGMDGSVLITFAHESISEDILDIADVSLRLREIEGTLFVQPEKPWESFFGIENSKGNGVISVRPMV